MDLDALDLFDAPDGPRPGAAPARKCRRHDNQTWIPDTDEWECQRCGHRTPNTRRPRRPREGAEPVTTKSKCDRCRKPLYGLVPCPACRELMIAEAIEQDRAERAARPDNGLPVLDEAYGKTPTYEVAGRCLTCGARFIVRREKGVKPPLSVDCPHCGCTEFGWQDLHYPLAPAQPAPSGEHTCGWCGHASPAPALDAERLREALASQVAALVSPGMVKLQLEGNPNACGYVEAINRVLDMFAALASAGGGEAAE